MTKRTRQPGEYDQLPHALVRDYPDLTKDLLVEEFGCAESEVIIADGAVTIPHPDKLGARVPVSLKMDGCTLVASIQQQNDETELPERRIGHVTMILKLMWLY